MPPYWIKHAVLWLLFDRSATLSRGWAYRLSLARFNMVFFYDRVPPVNYSLSTIVVVITVVTFVLMTVDINGWLYQLLYFIFAR